MKASEVVFDVYPSYKGGSTREYGGYVWEFCPGHRLQNPWGFVAQHRLVAEDMIGRDLQPGEHVHHKDECRHNNHPDNLQVMTATAHRSHHMTKMRNRFRAPITAEMVIEALEGRTIKEAARFLHVDTQTLRNRYPELIRHRQRRTPVKRDDPEVIAIVKEMAADPDITFGDLVKRTGMGANTARKICDENGFAWLTKMGGYGPRNTYRGKPTQSYLKRHGLPLESGYKLVPQVSEKWRAPHDQLSLETHD